MISCKVEITRDVHIGVRVVNLLMIMVWITVKVIRIKRQLKVPLKENETKTKKMILI